MTEPRDPSTERRSASGPAGAANGGRSRIDRRTFLAGTAGGWVLLTGCGVGPDGGPGAGDPQTAGSGPAAGGAPASPATRSVSAAPFAPGPPDPERLGLQLYTVRALMGRDVRATLEAVARTGYREVEFAGTFGHSGAEIRGWLDEFGLAAPAAHVALEDLERRPDDLITLGHELGLRYLIVAFIQESERRTVDDYRAMAARFEAVGARLADAGLRFAYHNHAFEFEPIDGTVPYRILLEETDPARVAFELDLFWIRAGGQDPLAAFQRFPGRFELCHVKDMDGDGSMVDVGAGAIDFPAIFTRAEDAGLRHYFVEHDQPTDPAASIRASFEHLAAISRG